MYAAVGSYIIQAWRLFDLRIQHHPPHWMAALIAVLLGLIPESGPHLIFVTLFAEGSLPLSILLASSVVQDGHSALPLLAETKQGFVWVKAINLTIGLAVGLSG